MIIDLINNAVTSIQVSGEPYYSYGTWDEEASRVTNLKNVSGGRDQKFPLIFFLLDNTESYISTEDSYESNLKLFIIGSTKKNYSRHKDIH